MSTALRDSTPVPGTATRRTRPGGSTHPTRPSRRTHPTRHTHPTRRTRPTRRTHPTRRSPLSLVSALAAALVVAGIAVAGVVGVTSPASAAAKVSVSGTPAADGESRLSLSGSGFQSVQGGFGGIYVLFGWADDSGAWRPSNGGKTGEDYRYVYDDESNPTGYQLFVAFPGSSTASAANGGEVASDGTWSGTIRIPGARFTTYDRAQNETTVDCTEVQCGIITIGAHGVVNAGNETFTPLDFPAGGDGGSGDSADTAAEAAAGSDADDASSSGDSATGDSATGEPGAGDEGSAAAGPRGSSAGAADEAQSAVPAGAGALLDPQAVADQQRQRTLLTLLVGVGIVLGLCVMALSFGVGGYLAMKALLLGVNPEALEKVRGKREERAVRAEHRRRRRVSDLRRREEIRSQRAEARNDGRVDRTAMEHGDTRAGHGGKRAEHGAPASTHSAIWDELGSGTPGVGVSGAGASGAGASGAGEGASDGASNGTTGIGAYGAGSEALLRFFEDEGRSSAERKQNASTLVLDRVEGTDRADAQDRAASLDRADEGEGRP